LKAHSPLPLLTALLLALSAFGKDPIPFELVRLQDKGGLVEIDYQLLLPPEKADRPSWSKIRTRLLQEFFPDEAEPDAQDAQARMAAAQAQLLTDFDEAYGGSVEPTQQKWSDLRRQRVSFEGDGLLVIQHINESYVGGAHPNAEVLYLLFDASTGRELVLADLLKAGSEAALTERIKAGIRRAQNVGEQADLNQLGFWEKDIRPQNLFVEKTGIGFHYNAYQIAPYSMGPTTITIPWNDIREWIRPESPLAQAMPPP
jgi:hypothetical protein